MHLTNPSRRLTNLDVAVLVRTPGGHLAVLVFKAAARGPLIRLESQTWDGISVDSEDDAIKTLNELADELGIAENNRVTDMLLHTDPLDTHFFLLEPWQKKCFTDAVQRSALFDGQRPVFTDIPPRAQS